MAPAGLKSTSRAVKLEEDRARMAEIIRVLKRTYPDAECSLTYRNPFELLIATMLSAQCTDERVNRATPILFGRYPTPEAMAAARLEDLEEIVRPLGFFRAKARAVSETSRALVQKHGGKVPETLESLTELRGVGRKTANVVLGNAFEVPGMVVDTHVGRISRRMGFTKSTDPVDVEHELMGIVEKKNWTIYSHLLIFHGRSICTARKAKCEECPIRHLCPKLFA